MHRETLKISSAGRSFIDITRKVGDIVARASADDGLCNVFVLHTSASLVITENADPNVLEDLEMVISDLAPDGDLRYTHTAEGPDDMSAHIRSILTQTSLSLPVVSGALQLGSWQGLFLWEHRARPHMRKVVVSVLD